MRSGKFFRERGDPVYVGSPAELIGMLRALGPIEANGVLHRIMTDVGIAKTGSMTVTTRDAQGRLATVVTIPLADAAEVAAMLRQADRHAAAGK